jgi:cytochrome c556
MNMKTTLKLLAASMTLILTLPAQAQFAKAEEAIKYRKASFTVMATHFGRLGAMSNGRLPYDAKAAADNAELVTTMSKLPWAAFGEGSDKGETRAKPEIWKESAKYKEASDKMQAEILKLNVAAKAGNVEALKAAFGPAAASCKACHDNFRKD